MQGRFNSFQRSMLQWNELHAYNAIHVIRMGGPLDLERLRTTIDSCLESLGLTNLRLNRNESAFTYEGGPARSEIKIVSPGNDTHQTLSIEIAQQINTRFPKVARFNPFRFFVMPEANAFSLGIVYFHPVADAESIVHLLERMVDNYLKQAAVPTVDPVDLYPAQFDKFLLRSPWLLARKLVDLPSLARIIRRSCRLQYLEISDFSNGFVLFSFPPDSLQVLTATSKAWEVTVNDLLLALLLKSLSGMVPERTGATRRKRISVGSVVNVRKDLGLDTRRTFGLFLGSFVVSHEVPDGISVENLAQAVRQQTRRIKNERLYLTSAAEMRLSRIIASGSSTHRRNKFYPKYYPLWGGITNMNLNSLWDDTGLEKPPGYFRAVSTGPATPIVLSVTTVGDQIHVGVTYRSTVFTLSQVQHIKSELLGALGQLIRNPSDRNPEQ